MSVRIPLNYSYRNLLTRKFTTALTAGGMALVSFVFAAVLMLAAGLQQTLVDTGSSDNVVALRGSAETEVSSSIEREAASIIVSQPEVEHDSFGDPLASKETLVLVTLPKKDSNSPTNVIVRGVGAHSGELRPQVRILSGRNPEPGSHEVIAGKNISDRIEGAVPGGKIHFAMIDWDVVGVFDAGKTAFSSEIWADNDQIMAAFRRNSYSVVLMKVIGAQNFESLRKRLTSDPRLSVQVKRELDFYRDQSEMMAKFIKILGLAMTAFFSVGAVLGAMVTMYTAVANRTREIGAMRALGFSRTSILLAFLAESVSLGLAGGLAGLAAGSLLQLLTISTMNWETFSELAFGFNLTTGIVFYTMLFALGMGLTGGLMPAWRASRLKIVDALRDN